MLIFDIETTGLDPLRSKVVTIQVKHGKDTVLWKLWEEKDEILLIKKFLDYIKNSDESIVGYNISRFDINFLLIRMLLNGGLTDEIQKLVKRKKWIDLTEFQKNNHGMDNWLRELNIMRKSQVAGRHVPVLYDLGQYDKIIEHAIDDLSACEEIIRKLNLKF